MPANSDRSAGPAGASLFRRLALVEPDEVAATLLSAAYFFFVLSSYYVIRPIRDEMGLAGGVENLAWLFLGTMLAMLAVHPLFAALVSRTTRARFIPIAYRFFALNLLAFFLILRAAPPESQVWVGRAFFIWTSVFNLFVVSIFWAFMADVFRSEQGKRLFGFIAVGGTIGAITGSGITAFLAEGLGPVNLLLVSAVLLEVAVWIVRALGRRAVAADVAPEEGIRGTRSPAAGTELPTGGSMWSGITHVARSPYLLNIVLYMLLFTIGSTFLYFQQAEIIARVFEDRAARTALFARIDLAVNILTLGTQLFITGRLLKWLGVAFTLALLPALSVVGFLALGLMPTLAVLVVFQVLRRGGNYAVARPTREVLFTILPREDKYKAKNFIDTFVYRFGDQVGAWSYTGLLFLGLGVGGAAFVAVPLAAAWVANSIWLGRRHREHERSQETAGEAEAAALSPA